MKGAKPQAQTKPEDKAQSKDEADDKYDPPSKQAVVIIHGIGEQVPMTTLRGFVDAVWVSDEELVCKDKADGDTGELPRRRNPVWTKPDKRNRSFELRRITTENDKNGVRTDFYEYYWAHLMHGTKREQVWAWIAGLLRRSYAKVPDNVFWPWAIGRFVVLVAIVGFVAAMYLKSDWWLAILAFFGAGIGATAFTLIGFTLRGQLVSVAGDIVRYVEAKPVNVARRQEIRAHGVQLLETLMNITPETKAKNKERIDEGLLPQWGSQYRRIIVAGHSLGSIVGYDLLKHAFARTSRLGLGLEQEQPARRALEDYCRERLEEPELTFEQDEFRMLQRAAFVELRAQGSPWIVSDFVTLGAALTHAEFLMADDLRDMYRQQFERVLPTCPPMLEWDRDTDKDHFSYRVSLNKDRKTDEKVLAEKTGNPDHFRYPHHASHFAFTRWTNLHSPSSWVLKGDLVSGEVGEHFGLRNRMHVRPFRHVLAGVKDVKVLDHGDAANKPDSLFTHLNYWKLKPIDRRIGRREHIRADKVPHHIAQLRKALDLLFDEQGEDGTPSQKECNDPECPVHKKPGDETEKPRSG